MIIRPEKRYVVYGWYEDEIEDANEYCGCFDDALESGRFDVADFGRAIGDGDSEDEAYNICNEASKYAMVSIYDTIEKYWFN